MLKRIGKERRVKGWFLDFLRDESGVTAMEYALVAALVGIVAVASLVLLGGELDNVFTCLNADLMNTMPRPMGC